MSNTKTIYGIYMQHQETDSDHWCHYLGESLYLICDTKDIAERELVRLVKKAVDKYLEFNPQSNYSDKHLNNILNNKLYYTTALNGDGEYIETDLFIIKEMNLVIN